MRKRILLLACAALAVAAFASQALAITGDGVADGSGHPYVAYARNTQFSCTASAVSPRLVVTAAHCFTFPTDNVCSTISDEFIKLSANASGSNGNGGTCFGDSGGPNLKGGTDTILAINSFVNDSLCAGVTYSYRLDTVEAAAFLAPYIAAYGPVAYGS